MFRKKNRSYNQRICEQHLLYQDGLGDSSTLHVMQCMQSILAQEGFDETVDGRFSLSVLNLADHLQKYVSCQTVAPEIRLADFHVVEKIGREQGDGRGWGRQCPNPIILPRFPRHSTAADCRSHTS